jgi:transcriptional regulator with XRE-family HTH domain
MNIEAENASKSRPWREVLGELRPDDTITAAVLRGSRIKEELTQERLSAMTGIPRRHISEMEHGKRSIGKESAKKLAKALNCDYRILL